MGMREANEQARDLRTSMEENIEQLIDAFEHDTGLVVTEVELSRHATGQSRIILRAGLDRS